LEGDDDVSWERDDGSMMKLLWCSEEDCRCYDCSDTLLIALVESF